MLHSDSRTINVTKKNSHLKKYAIYIGITILSILPAIGGLTFLMTNKSKGYEEPIVDDTEVEVEIDYDADYESRLTSLEWNVLIHDKRESFTANELGLAIKSSPSILQKLFNKKSKTTVTVNTNQLDQLVSNLAEQIYKGVKNSRLIIDGEDIKHNPGTEGYILDQDTALPNLIRALMAHDNTFTIDVKTIPPKQNIEDYFLRDKLEKLKTSYYWLTFVDHRVKIMGNELFPALEIGDHQIQVQTSKLINILKSKFPDIHTTSEIQLSDGSLISAPDTTIDYSASIQELVSTIESGKIKKHNYFNLVPKLVPGTDGTYHTRYIEVDLSQQMLYIWENGKLNKKYVISSGANNNTPTGNYSIINKARNAYSSIYKKWMPYWMAFTYLYKYGAWAGFHELTYWYDEYGNKVYEDENRLGQAVSGGCIRLGRGEAEEFYNWAKIGDPVLIHE